MVETNHLVSPPPRPSSGMAAEGQATGREGRLFFSNTAPGCLPPTRHLIILLIGNIAPAAA
ncbi:protein of unknown function [Candidatus Promineifilum breve]|uniref:Uncharacterized protein n=1 Tax=Candidatus Promineifilum breve TaxID=1806508 RepID=A0A160T140_9CHLR|nr:protein of unknown function [Candidatus Promineifilum breve]